MKQSDGPAMSAFWREEASEPQHKTIKKALLKKAGKDKKSADKPKHKAKPEHKKDGKKGISKKVDKVAKVMKEFSKKELHSGSKKGPLVKSKAQAAAIGYSEQKKENKGGYKKK